MRIAVTGPECTGKSSLAEQLSFHLGIPLVREFAREYLFDQGKDYSEDDLLEIARQQFRLNEKGASEKGVVCDTEIMVIKLWSLDRFGRCHPEIDDYLNVQEFDHYLLCFPDLPWVEDDLRELPDLKSRLRLYYRYEEELKKLNRAFSVITGFGEDRLTNARSFLSGLT